MTNITPDFPKVERPNGIPYVVDYRLGNFVIGAAGSLNERFPPKLRGVFTPSVAKVQLLGWCRDIAELIEGGSKAQIIDWHLAYADPSTIRRMERWLNSEWSADRDGLEMLLWRLGLPQQTVSGGLWLHRFAEFDNH